MGPRAATRQQRAVPETVQAAAIFVSPRSHGPAADDGDKGRALGRIRTSAALGRGRSVNVLHHRKRVHNFVEGQHIVGDEADDDVEVGDGEVPLVENPVRTKKARHNFGIGDDKDLLTGKEFREQQVAHAGKAHQAGKKVTPQYSRAKGPAGRVQGECVAGSSHEILVSNEDAGVLSTNAPT